MGTDQSKLSDVGDALPDRSRELLPPELLQPFPPPTSTDSSTTDQTGRHRRSFSSSSSSIPPIFRLLALRNWEAVLTRLSKSPKEASLSIKAEFYGIRREVLPLHLACALNPPASVVAALLKAHGDAASVLTRNCRPKKTRSPSSSSLRKLGKRGGDGHDSLSRLSFRSSINSQASQMSIAAGGGSDDVSNNARESLLASSTAAPAVPTSVVHESSNSVSSSSSDGIKTTQTNSSASTSIISSRLFSPASHKSTTTTATTASTPLTQFQLDISSDGHLPLHIAVLFGAKPVVVHKLVAKYPRGVKTKNGMGMLPIHIVCSGPPLLVNNDKREEEGKSAVADGNNRNNNANKTIIKTAEILLRTFPESVHVPSSHVEGKTPLEYVESFPSSLDDEHHYFSKEVKETLLKLLKDASAARLAPLAEGEEEEEKEDEEEEEKETDVDDNNKSSRSNSSRRRLSVDSGRSTSRGRSVRELTTFHSFRSAGSSCSNSTRSSASGIRFSLRGNKSKEKFDPNKPTKLYTHVSRRNWDAAMKRIMKVPSEASVWTLMDVSPEDAADAAAGGTSSGGGGTNHTVDPAVVIEVGESNYSCHRLPLHMACALKPPKHVVMALARAYPEGMSSREKFGMLPLHVACQKGASELVVKTLLAWYPEAASVTDAFGLLPLHLACTEGASVGVVTLLLKAYPHGMNVADKKGHTPIEYVRESFHPNKTSITRLLERDVEFWAAPDLTNAPALYHFLRNRIWEEALRRLEEHPEEASVWVLEEEYDKDCPRLPLHVACARKPPAEVVTALINAYPPGVKSRERHGALPIHVACQHGASPDAAQALLRAYKDGASVKDEFDLLPIQIACTEGSPVGVLKALLRAYPTGARVEDRRGYDAVHYARVSFHPNRAALLEVLQKNAAVWSDPIAEERSVALVSERPPKELSLNELIDQKEWKLIPDRLLKHPKDASTAVEDDERGMVVLPIHRLCTMKDAPPAVVMDVIIAAPDCVQCTNEKKELPLHLACRHRTSMDVIEALLEFFQAGASAVDRSGRLPLHVACIGGTTPDIVEALVLANPDSVYQKDSAGYTALDYAMASSYLNKDRVVKVLERYGADAHNEAPTTLYDLIANKQWVDAVKRARENPAEASMWNMDKACGHARLPIHLACTLNPPRKMIASLYNAYPKGVSTREIYGRYPLHVACQNGASLEVIQLLINTFPDAMWTKDRRGLLPVHVASSASANLDIIKLLFRAAAGSFDTADARNLTVSLKTSERSKRFGGSGTSGERRRGKMLPSRSVPAKLSVNSPHLGESSDEEENYRTPKGANFGTSVSARVLTRLGPYENPHNGMYGTGSLKNVFQ